MNRGPHWLTLAQAAVALKVSTAEIRRLIRKGELASVKIEHLGIHYVPRESVEAMKRHRGETKL